MTINNCLYKGHRNSYTELNEVYFWTITVHRWQHLLKSHQNKMIVIECLQWLKNNHLIEIYGFVIMPNHIHMLWKQLKMNGKEFPKNSFEKYTAKQMVRNMHEEYNGTLHNYAITASDRKHNIWQRDPLAVRIFSREMFLQKLNYIHNNPLQSHWNLCCGPEEHRFSSARFYADGIDEFGLLTHYMDVF